MGVPPLPRLLPRVSLFSLALGVGRWPQLRRPSDFRPPSSLSHALFPLPHTDTTDLTEHELLLSLAAEAARSPPAPEAGVAASPPSPPRQAPPPPPAPHTTAAAALRAEAAAAASSSYTEPLSGLRVSHALTPRGALATAVAAAAARFGKLPLAVAMLRGGGEGAPVATVGVVVAADAAPRTDRCGAPHTILALSDLDGTLARLCLRGRALESGAGVGVGTVVGVVGPRLAKPSPLSSSSSSKRPAPALLTIDSASCLLVLGRARDCGRCAAPVGPPGSGQRCGAPVSAARGPVCRRHAAGEAVRLRPGQGALADCGLAAHVARGLKRGRAGGRATPSNCDPVAPLPPAAAVSAASASTGGRDTHGVRFVEATVTAAAAAAAARGGVSAAAAARAWVKAPAVGRLGGRLSKDAANAANDDDAFVELAGDDDDDDGAAAPPPPPPPLRTRPPPQRRVFDPNRVERSSSAQRAALAALRRGKQGAAEGGTAGVGSRRASSTAAAPSSFEAAFASVASVGHSNTARPVSRYGAATGDAAPSGLDATLASLGEKDGQHQRAATLFRLPVKSVTCAVCRYTAEAPHPACAAGGHALVWGKATKRWFACGGCGWRTATLGARHPAHACRKCGATAFKRVAAAKDRAAVEVEGLAERAAFLPRGEEVPLSVKDW